MKLPRLDYAHFAGCAGGCGRQIDLNKLMTGASVGRWGALYCLECTADGKNHHPQPGCIFCAHERNKR